MDVAREIRIPGLREEIQAFLKDPTKFECFMTKTPLKKVQKNLYTVILFIVLMLFTYSL